MSWQIFLGGMDDQGLEETDEPVDGIDVFATFSEAKVRLARRLSDTARAYQRAAAAVRTSKKDDWA